jgi:hypothetical protein
MNDATSLLLLQQLKNSKDEDEHETDNLIVCFWGLLLTGKELHQQWRVEKRRE